MNKSFLVLIIAIAALGAVSVLFFMKKTADVAIEKRNDILKDFKTIDKDLKQSNTLIDSINLKLKDSLLVK